MDDDGGKCVAKLLATFWHQTGKRDDKDVRSDGNKTKWYSHVSSRYRYRYCIKWSPTKAVIKLACKSLEGIVEYDCS